MTEQGHGERWWKAADRDAIHTAAVEWFTRLQDPHVSLEATLAWQRWMSEDARHAQAFERMEDTWNVLGGVPLSVIESRPADRGAPMSCARRHVRALAIAASVVVVVAMGFVAMLVRSVSDGEALVLRTGIGENRSVRLEDGSRVMLGGGTELSVVMDEDSRQVSLAHGEAFFKVAKESARPFTVHAGNAAVTAVGTEFDVRLGGDRVTVAVVEGRVVVERSSRLTPLALLRELQPKLQPVRLSAGQQTTVARGVVAPASALPDPGSATAWQAGRLVYEALPLRYVPGRRESVRSEANRGGRRGHWRPEHHRHGGQ